MNRLLPSPTAPVASAPSGPTVIVSTIPIAIQPSSATTTGIASRSIGPTSVPTRAVAAPGHRNAHPRTPHAIHPRIHLPPIRSESARSSGPPALQPRPGSLIPAAAMTPAISTRQRGWARRRQKPAEEARNWRIRAPQIDSDQSDDTAIRAAEDSAIQARNAAVSLAVVRKGKSHDRGSRRACGSPRPRI